MSDVVLSVNSSLVDKLFDTVKYPWRKRIEGDRLLLDNDEVIVVEAQGQSNDEEALDDNEEYIDDLAEVFLENADTPQESGTAEAALIKLFQPYRQGRDTAASIKQALFEDATGGERLEEYFRAVRSGVFIDWIEFELSRKPDSNLGNPISLQNLRIAVRAKVKLCVRVFGKDHCLKMTTPWFRFEGEKVDVDLIVVSLSVKARAKARNIDFVVTVKIGKFKFKFKIGVTKYINRYLAKNSPTLFDLSGIAVKVPGLDLTYTPVSLSVPNSNVDTSIAIDGAFSS